jgi:hypothetical protein
MTLRFSQKTVERIACRWFQCASKAILASLDDPAVCEVGFTIYLDKMGKLQTTGLVFGSATEVNLPNAP